MRSSLRLTMGLGLLTMPVAATAQARSTPPAVPEAASVRTVSFDKYSFIIDGKRSYLWSGEFHPYRLPSPDLWRDIIQKAKAAGFNTLTIYFSWGYHSSSEGQYDFSGIRDMDRLLDMVHDAGLYVIARPGPYINAEVDGGGFPTWLSTKAGRNRSDDPIYLRYADEWLTQIDAILARHQWTDGRGPIVGYQIENEFYDNSPASRSYFKHLEAKARADGITVPLTGNHDTKFATGDGAVDVDGSDYYPQGFDCSNPGKWHGVPDMAAKRVAGQPLYTAEFQGGAFDPWGGPGYEKCAQLINDRFADIFYKQNIAAGATAQNFYMLFGGTSWGWQAIPQNYTSYDYGAAISENRQFDPKYFVDKRIGYLTQAVSPLLKTDDARPAEVDNPALIDIARINPDNGTQFHYIRHGDSTATTTDAAHLSLRVGDRRYAIPQAPGTAITLEGRESRLLLANYALGTHHLQYSTSELMTETDIAGRHIAILYGNKGQPGETVLRYARRPTVRVISGRADMSWDRGDLRLNYTHDGVIRVLVTDEGRSLLLLIGDTPQTDNVWRQSTSTGPVLVKGPHLLRSAMVRGDVLALEGDSGARETIEVFSSAKSVTWNGESLTLTPSESGSLTASLPEPEAVELPALDQWVKREEAPEVRVNFNDSQWQVADKSRSNSVTDPETLPVLFADDYGFHTGNTWYRGHFRANADGSAPTGIYLSAKSGGPAGAYSVWLNGTFLGSLQGEEKREFSFPSAALKKIGDNVVSVLTVNMGHEEDYHEKSENRTARGLIGARLLGAPATKVTWRIQGKQGGEQLTDPQRGVFNNGGLYGEREGWHLPGFDARSWASTRLPDATPAAGVTWYRTTARLALPKGQDTSLGLAFGGDRQCHYRASLFVNGWQMGNYVNDLGPQRDFPIPNGIIDPNGSNEIAVAVWKLDDAPCGLGPISLKNYGSYKSSLRVGAAAATPKPTVK